MNGLPSAMTNCTSLSLRFTPECDKAESYHSNQSLKLLFCHTKSHCPSGVLFMWHFETIYMGGGSAWLAIRKNRSGHVNEVEGMRLFGSPLTTRGEVFQRFLSASLEMSLNEESQAF